MKSIQEFLTAFNSLLSLVVSIIIGLALVLFLWGVAMFILQADNEDKRKEGKQKMIWGIIILAVMVGIWGIVNFLSASFGF